MTYEQGRICASALLHILAPFCERIVVAGSVRREKPTVNDIEIVLIPRLDWTETEYSHEFIGAVNQFEKIKGDADGKYTRRKIVLGEFSFEADIFIANRKNWGWILLLRTGSAEFNKRIIYQLRQKGYHSDGGTLWAGAGNPVNTPEESDVFRLLNIPTVKPKERSY